MLAIHILYTKKLINTHQIFIPFGGKCARKNNSANPVLGLGFAGSHAEWLGLKPTRPAHRRNNVLDKLSVRCRDSRFSPDRPVSGPVRRTCRRTFRSLVRFAGPGAGPSGVSFGGTDTYHRDCRRLLLTASFSTPPINRSSSSLGWLDL